MKMITDKLWGIFFQTFFLYSVAPPSGISHEGEMCGGMVPVNMIHHCQKPLECVYTKGPMIADAPGVCKPKCDTVRDAWGNCIPSNCEVWNDGCNTCRIQNKQTMMCTEKMCFDQKHEASCERYSTNDLGFLHCEKALEELSRMNEVCCAEKENCKLGFPQKCSPECSSIVNLLIHDCIGILQATGIDKRDGWKEFEHRCLETTGGKPMEIPANCAVWNDGCNQCQISNGIPTLCTKRMCLRIGKPHCSSFHKPGDTSLKEHGRQCFDGKDNDHDGKSDCDDPDCQFYGRCHKKESGKLCFDGKDNDHDGKTDCDDPDCVKDARVKIHCLSIH